MLVGAVADRHDHHVTFVALYRLEVLDEEAVEAALGEAVLEVRAHETGLLHGLVDGRGLCLGEGDHTEGPAGAGVEVVDDAIGDVARLGPVVAAAAPVVDAVGLEEGDTDVVALVEGAGEGHHRVLVERAVAEGDQILVAAAVVPAQGQFPHGAGFAGVQQGLEGFGRVLLVLVRVVLTRGVEERGRRQLLVVPGHDERTSAIDAVDRVAGPDL